MADCGRGRGTRSLYAKAVIAEAGGIQEVLMLMPQSISRSVHASFSVSDFCPTSSTNLPYSSARLSTNENEKDTPAGMGIKARKCCIYEEKAGGAGRDRTGA